MKILFEVVDKPVVKKTKYNKLNSKLNDLDDKIPHACSLFQIKITKDEQNLMKKVEHNNKKVPGTS